MAALVVLALIVSGPVAEAVGSAVGLGDVAVTAWDIAKWPVLLVVVMLMLAILYWSAPNAKPAGFRWVSPGSVVAVCCGSRRRPASRSSRELQLLRQDVRDAGRRDRLPDLDVDHEHRRAAGRGAQRRGRARARAGGRCPGREEEIQAPYRDVPKEERERAGRPDAQLSCAARRCRRDMRVLIVSSPGRSSPSSRVRMWPDAGAAATGATEISAETRAATLRFAPDVKPRDRAWILAAIRRRGRRRSG